MKNSISQRANNLKNYTNSADIIQVGVPKQTTLIRFIRFFPQK